MKAQEIIDRVRQELVETVGAFWSDSELLNLINKGERDFARRTRILQDKAQTGTTQGDPVIPLPSNWLSARAVFYNNKNTDGTDNWIPLRGTNLEKMKQERPNFLSSSSNLQSKPNKYWIWDGELHLDPVPDTTADANIVMFFAAKPIPLIQASQDLNVDDSLSDGIEAYVRWKAWKKEKEPDLAQEAKEEYYEFVAQGRSYVKRKTGDEVHRIDIVSPIPLGAFNAVFNPFLE